MKHLIIFIFFAIPYIIQAQSLSDTLLIEEVVVSSSRVEVSRRNVPVTVSTISREQIELSNESAVLPVLSHRVPGMFVTERGVTGFGVGSGSAGQISMRGVGGTAPNTQVLVLLDGHPQFQGLFAHPIADAYVSSDVEKVEVIRGPASILYGSNAMAGTINIITRQQTQDGFSGNAKVSYGSFNTQKYMASGGIKEGRFSLFASINHNSTDSHRDTADFSIVNGFIKAGYQVNPNIDITVDFSLADFTSEDPGTIYNPSYFGIDILRGKASVAVRNNFENLEGGMIAFYNFGKHEFTNDWVSEDFHAGVSLYQGLQLFEGNRLTLGADYKKLGGIANSGVPGAADVWHNVSDMAAYAFMQQSLLNKLILSAGLRLENNSLFGIEPVPQAGISFIATESITFKGSFSKGFRSPSLMELYLFAPNPELRPERMMNYEAGAGYQSLNKKFSAEMTFFIIEGDNIIEVMPNDAPPPPVKRQNVGSFSNKGFELETNWIATSNINFSANYSFIDLDAPRLAAPEQQFYLEGTYRNRNFRTNISTQQIKGLYTYIGDDPVSESYSLVNLMLSYRFNTHIEVFASGKNLLDEQYTINYGYPMPGIHFMAGVNLSF